MPIWGSSHALLVGVSGCDKWLSFSFRDLPVGFMSRLGLAYCKFFNCKSRSCQTLCYLKVTQQCWLRSYQHLVIQELGLQLWWEEISFVQVVDGLLAVLGPLVNRASTGVPAPVVCSQPQLQLGCCGLAAIRDVCIKCADVRVSSVP